jgi:hypothetical protein
MLRSWIPGEKTESSMAAAVVLEEMWALWEVLLKNKP